MLVEEKADTEIVVERDGDVEEEKKKVSIRPVGALVPFANPLADEKVARKVFKGVKRGVYPIFSSPNNDLLVSCSRSTSILTPLPPSSCRIEIAQTRRQGSRQSAAEILDGALLPSSRRGRLSGRYLSHGRHLAHSSPL